jgi:hypothetical protein
MAEMYHALAEIEHNAKSRVYAKHGFHTKAQKHAARAAYHAAFGATPLPSGGSGGAELRQRRTTAEKLRDIQKMQAPRVRPRRQNRGDTLGAMDDSETTEPDWSGDESDGTSDMPDLAYEAGKAGEADWGGEADWIEKYAQRRWRGGRADMATAPTVATRPRAAPAARPAWRAWAARPAAPALPARPAALARPARPARPSRPHDVSRSPNRWSAGWER